MSSNRATRPLLLVECGPLFDIEARVGLIRKGSHQIARRAFLAALLAWLPLFVLSSLQGTAFGHRVPVPFLRDYSAWSRFLLAIPLFVLAEKSLGPRIANAAEHFVESGVVDRDDYHKFDRAVEQALRLRESKAAEFVIAIVAYLAAITGFRLTTASVSTWYAIRTDGGGSLTWAGWWLVGFSIPLFHFMMFRWLWRLFIWFRFLGSVRNLNLKLFPTHPDKAAGLAFVGEAQKYFRSLPFACSIGVAGVLANEIVYDRIPLQRFIPAIAAYVLMAIVVLVGPLAIFSKTLLRTKRRGLDEYGTLATSYTGSFQRKWILGENLDNEPLLGTGDIQSLADMGSSYAYIERMYALPISPGIVVHLAIVSFLPMTPLLLSIMPLREVVKLLFKLLA